jgi:branched-chain amino acid transport system substrate-binding protein
MSKLVLAAAEQTGANVIIFSHDVAGKMIAPRVAARLDAGLVPGATALPSADFVVRKNVFSGKAIAEGVKMTAADVPFNTLLTAAQLADFTKVTGVKVPGLYSGTAWTATNVFIQCIKEGAKTRSAIQKCVNNGTFTDAGGNKFKFDRYGDPTTASAVGGYIVTKDGEIIYDKVA